MWEVGSDEDKSLQRCVVTKTEPGPQTWLCLMQSRALPREGLQDQAFSVYPCDCAENISTEPQIPYSY